MAAHQVAGGEEEDERGDDRDAVEPLVRRERKAEGRLDLLERDSLHAAGEALEAAALEELREDHAERERGQREVEALEPDGGEPEEEAQRETDAPRAGERQPVRDVALVDEDGRRVRADAVEGAVPQRDLPSVSRQQIEPEERNGVDDDEGELEEMVRGAEERKRAREEDRARRHGARRLAVRAPRSIERARGHVRPSSPGAGRRGPRAGRSGHRR